MSGKKKAIIAVGVLVVLAVIIGLNLRSNRVPTTEVEVEPAKLRTLVSIVEASGQIEPSISVDISSDVIGRIIAVGVEEGDLVAKGDFLIQVDPTQLEQRVVQFQAGLDSTVARQAQATANLEQADLEFVRQKNLWDQALISKAEFDSARVARDVNRANLTASKFAVNQARASLEEARDSLSKCRILAPMDGIVIRKNAEVGETAISGTLNNAGSLLMTIADTSSMETEVEVDETDVVDIRLGHEAAIDLDAFPDREFRGLVTKIANSSVLGASGPGQPQQSANYKVTVRLLEMPETIRPGLSATARITTSTQEEALAVPIQSLTIREVKEDEADGDEESAEAEPGVALADTSSPEEEPPPHNPREVPEPAEGGTVPAVEEGEEDEPGKWEREGVFVVRDDKAVFVPVEVGIAGEKHFQVSGELEAGDQVISGPFTALRNLKDGDAVKIKEQEEEKDESGEESKSSS